MAMGLLLLAMPAACGPATLMAPTDGGVAVMRDLRYGAGPRRVLDVYRPAAATAPRPVIVYFYGGLWTMGTKADVGHVTLARQLASRGAVVVVPDYRLHPDADFPDFQADGAAAVAWARRHAAEFGGDPRAIFIAGHSTGAYMAVMLGLDGGYLAAAGFGPPAPAGLIGLAGVYERYMFESRVGRPIFGSPPDLPRILPAYFLKPGIPPMLLLAGNLDLTVDPDETRHLAAAARATGGDAEAKVYPGIGHLGILAAAPLVPSLSPMADDVAAFVRGRVPPPEATPTP